jgi:hypothetical protein
MSERKACLKDKFEIRNNDKRSKIMMTKPVCF